MVRRVRRHALLLGVLGGAIALLAAACAGPAPTPVVVEREVVVEKEVPVVVEREVEVVKEVPVEVVKEVVVVKEVPRVVEVEKVVVREVVREPTTGQVRVPELDKTVQVPRYSGVPAIHLRCEGGWPAGEYMSVSMRILGDVMTAMSGGSIIMEDFYGQALWKQTEVPDALGGGLGDCGNMLMLYYRGTYPVSGDGTTLPFLFTPVMAADAINIPFVGDIIRRELAATNMIPAAGIAGITTWFFKTPLPDIAPADGKPFKGLRIRGFGMLPDVIRAFGGEAVSFPSPEIPIAFRQGQMDAFTTSYGTWYNLGVVKDAPVAYRGLEAANAFVVAFNKDLWDSFPRSVQNLINEAGVIASQLGLENAEDEVIRIQEEVKDDVTFIDVTPEQKLKWIEWTKPLVDKYAAKSPEHQQWLDTLVELAQKGYTPSWER